MSAQEHSMVRLHLMAVALVGPASVSTGCRSRLAGRVGYPSFILLQSVGTSSLPSHISWLEGSIPAKRSTR